MNFRKIIFWLHLFAGLGVGIVVAIMSFTGVAIAFEAELLAWLDRDVSRVAEPIEKGDRLTVDAALAMAGDVMPELRATGLTVSADTDAAWLLQFGRERSVYLDPSTGEFREMASGGAHAFMHLMTDWHRWLGMEGPGRKTGRAITGACNLAFFFLILSGIYLWFPRRWSWRAFRPAVWFLKKTRGRARDWNWHNVIGFWSAPVLAVLVATAVVISYPWAGNLVYRIVGEEPPPPRRGPPGAAAAEPIPAPRPGEVALSLDAQLRVVAAAFPDWQEITLRLPSSEPAATVAATVFSVKRKGQRPRFSNTTASVDPYRGTLFGRSDFSDFSTGRKARSWIRYLHTGEAFGFWGKWVATLASAGALVLVWTGFALSWRRFFAKRRRAPTEDARTRSAL